MAQEKKRGCGFRKVGGLYLCGESMNVVGCGRLPINMKICPVCGEGLRISRGYRWIDGTRYIGGNCEKNCKCHEVGCVICNSDTLGRCLVMSVGKKFYSPEGFISEAKEQGISKRISHIPKGIELGKTWVLLAHPDAGTCEVEDKEGNKSFESCPAVFYVFLATRIEKLVKKSQATEDVIKDMEKRNITPVVVDDADADHQGNVYDDHDKEKKQKDLNGFIGEKNG